MGAYVIQEAYARLKQLYQARQTRGASMTNDQIKARCKEAANSATFLCLKKAPLDAFLESLYREAMAEGLEWAADNYVRYKPSLLPKAGCAPWPPQPFEDLLRAEAQQVKEAK